MANKRQRKKHMKKTILQQNPSMSNLRFLKTPKSFVDTTSQRLNIGLTGAVRESENKMRLAFNGK